MLQVLLMMMQSSIRQFSSAARRYADKLYELRVYSFKISNTKPLVKECKEALPIRYSHSPGLGYFFAEIGGIGESVHIWEYETYAQRAAIRKSLAGDPGWNDAAAPMLKLLEKQENVTMRLFPWSVVQTAVAPGGVYHLYTFSFPSESSMATMSESLQEFIKEADLTALGVWREELGKNIGRNAYALFHSPDYDSAKNPALASPQAWEKLAQTTSNVHGRLLSPAEWSSYQ
ncbi:protein NipSnap homolog 3B-like [Watersipora subatra]|uniref:protein NipSnap homolog 3B-like n=1 Tax=Watersipora subatra TaxID=2589382 RepID=UPI00355BCDFE